MSETSTQSNESVHPVKILSISAVTLATRDMKQAVCFYRSLGFELQYGGEAAPFTTFSVGTSYLNLTSGSSEQHGPWWGRIIFHVEDVDAFYAHVLAQNLSPDCEPMDAQWGERYFHLTDTDAHELSFATPLDASSPFESHKPKNSRSTSVRKGNSTDESTGTDFI